nr:SDR family oxidoreductase [Erythrobacter sp.]
MTPLHKKRGIVLGVANDQSLAWGCAKAFHDQGAQLALSYFNDKAKVHVAPLAEQLEAPIFQRLDVTDEDSWNAFFDAVKQQWGQIDFALHSIVFAPKEDLHGRVVDCGSAGFLTAIDISCHSFIRMAKECEPLMQQGGSILTMSYYGAQRVIEGYNMMGPVKSALRPAFVKWRWSLAKVRSVSMRSLRAQ